MRATLLAARPAPAAITVSAAGLTNAAAAIRTVTAGVNAVTQKQWVGAGPEAIQKGFKLSLTWQGQVYTSSKIAGGATEAAIQAAVEAGFAGIGSLNWNGLFVPVKTPQAIVDRLFKETVAVMSDPEMRDYLAKRSIPLTLSESPAAFNKYVLSEAARWDKIIRSAGIKGE